MKNKYLFQVPGSKFQVPPSRQASHASTVFRPSAFSIWPSAGKGALLVLLAMSFLCAPFLSADSARGVVAQGNTLFDKGKYDEALQKYTRAQALKPNDPLLAYNVGDVLFKQKDYDKAVESFQKASGSSDTKLAEAAFYNMGNCRFAKEDYAGAIEMFKQALNLNQDDADAKFNLELARNKLKDQSKPQQKQNQQQNQQNQQQKDQKKDQSDQSDKSDKSDKQKQDQEKQQQGMEKKKISEEEARRILDALKNKEKEEQKKQLKKMPGQAGRGGEDW